MKKVFASAVAAALALTMTVPAFAANHVTMTAAADKEYVKAGETFDISFDITGAAALDQIDGKDAKIGAADWMVTYDSSKVELVEKEDPDLGTKFYMDMGAIGKLFASMVTPVEGGASIQIFDASATGIAKDFSAGTVTFKVKDGVEDGTKIEIGLKMPQTDGVDSSTFVLINEDKNAPSVPLAVEDTTLTGTSVTVGAEPTDEPTTDEPTTDEPTTDEPTTDPSTDKPSDTTTTTGNNGTGTTTAKPGNNNKTGDAGVLAIGGLMVLAAGATMLTLKKKSK